MASSSSNRNRMIVDVHYKGIFVPKPLVYFEPRKASVRDMDFASMGYGEFVAFLEGLTNERCTDIYSCPSNETLTDGIKRMGNEGEYNEFLEDVSANGNRMSVYIDHYNEAILDWVEEELAESEEEEDDEEDVDSQLSDNIPFEHEEDEVVVSLIKTLGDPFLSKLCVLPSRNQDDGASDVDEDGNDQVITFPEHDENLEWDKMVPILGMKFSDPSELKLMLTNYAVAHGYDLWFEKNDKDRLLVRCCKLKNNPRCPFRLWASWMTNERTFQIKSLHDVHSCSRSFKLGSIVNYKWIGNHFVNEILVRPKMSLRKMKAEVTKKFNLKVSIGQCRNARKFAMHEIEGTLTEHYAKLWSYAEEIRRANPGSTVQMMVDIMPDSTTYFSRYYVCFKGVKDGWIEGCRRVIGIDGCFLKGVCRGELLAAVGRDSNNHIYPIAWAVVHVESKDTWKWFLDLLMDDIGMGDGNGLTLISDQHKGIIEAVKERVPEAEHRQCARHIYANFRKKGYTSKQWKKLFWKVAKATTEPQWQAAMNEVKSHSKEAFEYLMDKQPKSWSRAYQQLDRSCDTVENGISESFNAAIVDARKKPLITMLEEIRIFVMERLYTMKLQGQNWDLEICPAIRKQLVDLRPKHRYWSVTPSGVDQFEVRLGYEAYGVDLTNRTCECRLWQLSGVPCVHAMAAIADLNRNPEHYVSTWYTTNMFRNCYRYTIHPLNGSDMWPLVDCNPPLPPKRRRLPGRPKIKRRMDQSERDSMGKTRHTVTKRGMIMRCTICREQGHNKLRCPQRPNPDVSSSKKKSKKAKTSKKSTDDVDQHVDVVVDQSEDQHVDVVVDQHVDVVVDQAVEQTVDQHKDQEDQDEDEQVGEEQLQDVDEDQDEDQQVGEEQPQVTVTRKRKPSERIMKIKLSTNLGGEGSSQDQPLTLV